MNIISIIFKSIGVGFFTFGFLHFCPIEAPIDFLYFGLLWAGIVAYVLGVNKSDE